MSDEWRGRLRARRGIQAMLIIATRGREEPGKCLDDRSDRSRHPDRAYHLRNIGECPLFPSDSLDDYAKIFIIAPFPAGEKGRPCDRSDPPVDDLILFILFDSFCNFT